MRLLFSSLLVVSLLTMVNAFSLMPPQHRRAGFRIQSSRNSNRQLLPLSLDPENEATTTRINHLGRETLSSLQLKSTIERGDTVVCKREVPSAGIYENRSYQVTSIYAQRFNPETQQIDRLVLDNLDDTCVPDGYDCYVTLFSSLYHQEPVVVTPQEVGLVSVRSEVVDSMWLAVPGIFWVFVCYNIYSIYHERTGGSFSDAFWGR